MAWLGSLKPVHQAVLVLISVAVASGAAAMRFSDLVRTPRTTAARLEQHIAYADGLIRGNENDHAAILARVDSTLSLVRSLVTQLCVERAEDRGVSAKDCIRKVSP